MMNPKKVAVLIVAALALSAVAFVQEPQDPRQLPKPLVTFRGEFSKVDETRYLRVTDAETWATLWCEHTGQQAQKRGYGWYYNQQQVPIVDFERCMVVAVFGGKCGNTAGYRVEQVLDGDRWTLRYHANSYQTTVIDPANAKAKPPSTPFGMFVLPKTDKKVALEENVQGMIGRPPKWRLQATL